MGNVFCSNLPILAITYDNLPSDKVLHLTLTCDVNPDTFTFKLEFEADSVNFVIDFVLSYDLWNMTCLDDGFWPALEYRTRGHTHEQSGEWIIGYAKVYIQIAGQKTSYNCLYLIVVLLLRWHLVTDQIYLSYLKYS